MYDENVSLPTIRFAVGAGHGGASMLEGARAFATALGETLQQKVQLVVADDYEQLLTKVLGGGAELAWMPPLLHAKATLAGATLAVVSERDGAVTYRSALLVAVGSPAKTLADLHDVRVAWSDPKSAAGHIFPREHLVAAGVTFAAETFAGSPLAACAAVADGEADVCACFVREAAATVPARALADVSRVYAPATWRLRVLSITDAIPPDGIVLAPTISPADAARYVRGLRRMHEKPAGLTALWSLMSATRLVKPPR